MARDIDAGTLAAMQQAIIRPAVLAAVETSSGTVRVWSGTGSLFWGGGSPPDEFIGLGKYGGISSIGETRDIRAQGIKLSLSGIPSDMVSLALDESRPGLPVNIWIGMFDINGVLITDPYLAFSGLTDEVNLIEGGDTSTLEISAESELIRLQHANETRYTHDSQQVRFPGDMGFEFVEQLQDFDIPFGPVGNNIPIGQKLVSRR